MDKMTDIRAAEAQAQGVGEVVAWVSRNDAMFTDAGNWRCTNPLLYSSQESPSMIPLYTAPPIAPVGVEGLVRDLVREIERNTCAHEDTHRGGAVWEICDACGTRWADDRGGKPDFKWPDCVERAHAWLAQQPAAVDGAMVERAFNAWCDQPGQLDAAIDQARGKGVADEA